MNRLEKDLLFYSNYCLHSSNLLNSISKTSLNSKVFYICIDDNKIKVPNFITRVPSVFLVKDKKVLVEDEIDQWINAKLYQESQFQKSKQTLNNNNNMNQPPQNNNMNQFPQNNNMNQPLNSNIMERQLHNNMNQPQQNNNNMERQLHNNMNQPPQNNNMNQPQLHNNRETQPESVSNQKNSEDPEDIMAYHGNEMGSIMSGHYSFIEDGENSSLNHNFSFLDNMDTNTQINTPKEFNKNDNGTKTKSMTEYDRLLEQRNNESFSKGVQRI